ncbi:MAG: hypothetical protein XE11_0836 [Methanomicrobiales archaeon 53_19]|jgi:hypothetical protein|nr:MAG: hypothetical protein XD88_0041 [Methanocalculus sp. 52_23]KUL04111.1 MAG: hypothetical protein XE11_0836 [Methanomicrobiales archaeon 53_19]
MFLKILVFLLILMVMVFCIGIWEEGAKRGFAGMMFYVGLLFGMAGMYMAMKRESNLKS